MKVAKLSTKEVVNLKENMKILITASCRFMVIYSKIINRANGRFKITYSNYHYKNITFEVCLSLEKMPD